MQNLLFRLILKLEEKNILRKFTFSCILNEKKIEYLYCLLQYLIIFQGNRGKKHFFVLYKIITIYK